MSLFGALFTINKPSKRTQGFYCLGKDRVTTSLVGTVRFFPDPDPDTGAPKRPDPDQQHWLNNAECPVKECVKTFADI